MTFKVIFEVIPHHCSDSDDLNLLIGLFRSLFINPVFVTEVKTVASLKTRLNTLMHGSLNQFDWDFKGTQGNAVYSCLVVTSLSQ